MIRGNKMCGENISEGSYKRHKVNFFNLKYTIIIAFFVKNFTKIDLCPLNQYHKFLFSSLKLPRILSIYSYLNKKQSSLDALITIRARRVFLAVQFVLPLVITYRSFLAYFLDFLMNPNILHTQF